MRAAIHLGTERTRAAILFADLSGFTALVESSRPETVYRRIRPIMDELVSVVTEHGGDIQQVLGDGFMAVFGLRAQRADAGPYSEPVEHAVRAAIALVRAGADLRGGLPVHVGIECGEVLVSPSWEPARFAVWGRAVTMAKRLCDTAGPGTIHVGQLAYENGGGCVLAGWNGGFTTCVSARLEGIADNVVIHSVTLRTPALCGGA